MTPTASSALAVRDECHALTPWGTLYLSVTEPEPPAAILPLPSTCGRAVTRVTPLVLTLAVSCAWKASRLPVLPTLQVTESTLAL